MPEERKLVTILFADVVGSTILSGQIDPEELREKMGRFFGIAREEIERFGGTVEKFIGDAVMAVFGLPATREDDAARAVHAAVSIRAHARPFIQAGTVPEIRIGINSGEVVADPRAAAKGEFMVTGEAVNIAARLQQYANPGQILVGEATVASTQWAFDYRSLAPVQVKGKAEKISAYECTGIKPEPLAPRGAPGVLSPLVGRDAEVGTLAHILERLRTGRGAIVLVIGEPGIGKSRLSSEMRHRVAEWDITWLVGRTLSISNVISYWPFLEVIKGACMMTESDSQEESWTKLEARVASLLPDHVDEIAPYLGTLLGLEIKEAWRDRVQYLDGEALGRQIYRSTRLFFAALAQERPLVLMIEDLHWIDHSSAELLEHLLPLSTEVPILFYGITRPGRDTPMARLRDVVLRDYVDRYTEISLQPLSPEHSDELVRNLLQISDLPAGVRHLVLERSEGNPFFVEEVTRALIDLGALTRDASGRWQVSRQIDRISIPDTLRGVIVARIDRLDEDVKQILKTASVIGRNFFYRVLRAIAEAGAELDRYLLDLEQLEFIKERRRDPELEYAFKHALTQEATYETILLRVRRELHRRVAETIEQLFAGRLEEFYGLLAYHYARVENWERAQDYLFRAGDQAVRVAADAEALSYYQQASAAYARVFGDRWDPLQRAILERKMGEALFRRGQHDQAMEYLQRALVHLGHPFPSSRWGVLFTILGQLIRQVGHRLLPSVFLRYPADRPPPPAAEERARIYEAMGWIDYFLSVNRLILEGLLLLNVSEQNRFLFGIGRGSMAMGLVCDLIPAFGLAGSYHRRAVAVAEQIQHPLALGLTYLGLALHELHVGEWDSALQHFRRSAASYREAGELRQWGAAASVEAWLLRMRGEFQSSLELDHEMIRVGEEAADPQLRGWGLTEAGNTLWQIGNVDEAIPALREAVELFRAVPDYRWVVLATSGLGMCYLRQGRTEEALSVFEDAHRIIVDRGFKGFLGAVPRGGLTEVYLAAAEAARDVSRDAWLKKADRLSREFLKQSKTDIEALPSAHRLRGQLAWLRGERRQAIQSWQASERIAERLGAKYDLALTAFEIGHRTADEVQLRRAETIFADIGARWDPARAEALIPPSAV